MKEGTDLRLGGWLGLAGLLISGVYVAHHYWTRPWDFADEDFRLMALLIVIVFTFFSGFLGLVLGPLLQRPKP